MGLFWEEVHFFPCRRVALFIPSSKTDPGLGAWVFLAEAPAAVRALCPVRALGTLQGLSRVLGTGVVFPTRDGARRALSKSTVGPRLRQALQAVGVQNSSLQEPHTPLALACRFPRSSAWGGGVTGIVLTLPYLLGCACCCTSAECMPCVCLEDALVAE